MHKCFFVVVEGTWWASRFQNRQNAGKNGKLFEIVSQKCSRDIFRVYYWHFFVCFVMAVS